MNSEESNMESTDEKIGYLRAQSEENKNDLVRIERKVDALSDLVSGKFRTAETVFNVLKFIGVAIVAVLTFKFGDIKEWFNFLFKR